MATSLERRDKSDPSTWTMSKTDSSSLESRILAALNAKGHGATSVELETGKLKGGYICDTMRVFIGYGTTSRNESPKSPKGGAREEAEGRQFGTVALSDLPKSSAGRARVALLREHGLARPRPCAGAPWLRQGRGKGRYPCAYPCPCP